LEEDRRCSMVLVQVHIAGQAKPTSEQRKCVRRKELQRETAVC